jgi:lycopene cyclase domain-containing protein
MYLSVNLNFIAFALACMFILVPRTRWAAYPIAMIPMLLLTVVFDNAIILSGIVGYDKTKISGVMIGAAPIEDFFYTVAAVLIVPSVWTFLGRVKK